MAAHTIYAHNNQLTIIKIISKTWFSGLTIFWILKSSKTTILNIAMTDMLRI